MRKKPTLERRATTAEILEAMGLDRVRTELSAQYVDHNLIQEDFKNPDDHLFLQSACERFGMWYSRAGNGVSHPVHQERFGKPGATMAGSDSHTPAAGAVGMLAIGSGGLDVALAMAGEPVCTGVGEQAIAASLAEKEARRSAEASLLEKRIEVMGAEAEIKRIEEEIAGLGKKGGK